MKVGVKYCGGCNPRYDRVDAVNSVKKRFSDMNFEYAIDNQFYDFVMVVCGCTSACASHNLIGSYKSKYILKSHEEFKILDLRKEI